MNRIKEYLRVSVLISICFGVCLVLAPGMMAASVFAAELPEGTIITKDNLDKIKNDTFQGKTIASMLTPSIEMQIRDWNMQIKLAKTKIVPKAKNWVESTKKYSKDVVYDPATREITNYKAGVPFPDVDVKNDPHAGDKLGLNFYYGNLSGNIQYVPHSWLLIDADSGLERVQEWFWLRYYTTGIYIEGKPPIEDEKILTKTLFFITYPYDLKGVGLFTIRWNSPKLETTWVYVKSVRRTRRLSGGSWIDPVGSLDMLNDDIWCWNARVSWYPKVEYKETRTILAMCNAEVAWNEAKKGTHEEFPAVDLDNYPHWNPSIKQNTWEPREVYVLDCTPPDRHPYSMRTVYMDVTYPALYIADCVDKRGNYWKYIHYSYGPMKSVDGQTTMVCPQGWYVDFKRRHGSIHYIRSWTNNDPSVTSDDVTLGQLRAASK